MEEASTSNHAAPVRDAVTQPPSSVHMSSPPVIATTTVNQSMTVSQREELLRQQVQLVQRMMQSARNSNPPTHTHTHSHAQPHTPAQMDLGHPAEMVLNMGEPEPAPAEDSTPSGQNRGQRRRPQSESLQGIPFLGPLLRYFEGAVPFLILLFAKVMYNHRLGLLLFLAMIGTFYYANGMLKKLIILRDNQTGREAAAGFIWLFVFLLANIAFIYYFFNDHKLYNCLMFQSPDISELDIWTLLWVTVTTDFVVKFATIAGKSVIAMLPKYVLPYKKKGKYFLLVEMISQFYRSVLPIRLWTVFMLEDKFGGQWMAVVLFIAFGVFKVMHLRKKFYETRRAVGQCTIDSAVGSSASREEKKAFDNTCPICHDIFSDAVKLSCKHIFCDDCISLWLDHEKTCPMCRAHIVDNPAWRDGSSSMVVQFF